jgi:hypothetical protein
MPHPIRVGVGGWSFEPWDETEGEAAGIRQPQDDGG